MEVTRNSISSAIICSTLQAENTLENNQITDPVLWRSTLCLIFFLLLSERTPLERCCDHNMRHSSRVVAFLQVVARPEFRGPRSDSIARSQVWLGLPAGRFQSGGTCRIHAARARWWSSRGELHDVALTEIQILLLLLNSWPLSAVEVSDDPSPLFAVCRQPHHYRQ